MPDWFYRTVARYCLDRLPDRLARTIALETIGTLGRSAPGRAVIDFLGHMRAPNDLAGSRRGVAWRSPVGLGPWIDPEGRATRALARFGTGFIEVGPVDVADRPGEPPRRAPDGLIVPPAEQRAATAASTWQARLAHREVNGVPVWIRIAVDPALPPESAQQAIESIAAVLASEARVFVVERPPAGRTLRLPRPWLRVGEPDTDDLGGWAGVVLDPERTGCTSEHVREARQRLGPDPVLVAAGTGDPADLRTLLRAGADLVTADGALRATGPGVIKRTNELLAASLPQTRVDDTRPTTKQAWFWAVVLGAALAGGGLLTLFLALGPVLLPYDEHHLGIDAATLQRLMPRLHDFMAHDRATLAGTMLGLGGFYLLLAREGVRRGQHWAHTAIRTSALTGFATFFFFLGFGYFDPLHAFVSAVLLQFTIALVIASRRPASATVDTVPDERSDAVWRRAQWGQLLLVLHAAGLLIAGLVISTIGMTAVFVATDLAFLCATVDDLARFNDRLIGVVAHDRAALGGMLLASGLAQLLATLWGMRRGRRWLWLGLLVLGLPAYTATLGIHLWVGYTDAWHLAPAFAGLTLWLGGVALTADWMRDR
ncbi:hypothetical protein ASA1KI_05040 [Opitutales bacterium ASA1]|uniref:hypothetical protein n=1 Tax=Congregicoccus parvus TaxID=3081749 RepID=UPI002B2C499A|nr:hypothetical protein ASA1KI_05040 [Opitutales bacterium ASA1]